MFKTPSGPSTGKPLLNHTIFSPSQTGETVPLTEEKISKDSYLPRASELFIVLCPSHNKISLNTNLRRISTV